MESDDDRQQVQKRQESDKALTGCFIRACIVFALIVVLGIVGLLDFWSGA